MKAFSLVVLLAAGAAAADEPDLAELSFGQLSRRATILELERPWMATPVLLLVGGGLLSTGGLGLGVAGIACIFAALNPYGWAGVYAAMGAFALVTGAGLAAGGLSMLRGATEKLRQRAMVNEELVQVRALQSLPFPVEAPMAPVLTF